MKKELPKVYEPQEVEGRVYEMWEKNGCFAGHRDPDKKPFTIVMPPPNVTGQLHMGHAMDCTLQDILIRFKRMQGYAALWVPGTDHAGIATQIKVEEELRKNEGLTRYDLGREKFLERVWDWKNKFGDRIVEQQKKLGASCDWDRARFTMDEGLSKAVREVFVSLYEKGLIYKGSRIINWCPHCVTALSDAEVEYKDKPGHLWHIKLPHRGGAGPLCHRGHHPAGDHAGGHRRGRQPQRRALSGHRGQEVPAAPDGPGDPHRGRRVRGHGVRHRLREDDPRPRPQRLRGGPAPQPGVHPGAGRPRRW